MPRHLLLSCLLALLLPAQALAHGGEPIAKEALKTDGAGGWALVTNFGIISHDDLTHYVCEEAFLGGDDFRVVALGPTRWLTFSRAAIMKTDDGCTFRQIAPLERAPAAVTASGERVAYASNQEGARGIFISEDGGERFEPLTALADEQVLWTGLGAQADGALVASGYDSSQGDERGAARLWRIAPSGAVASMTLPQGAKYPYLMAARGDSAAGIMAIGEAQHAFWIKGGALTQRELERWPSGMALSEDGRTLHIAGATQAGGLWRSSWDGGAAPSWEIVAADHPARCVSQPGELLICALRMTQEHDVSLLKADGSWEPRVRFQDLLGPKRGCPAGSQVRVVCPAVWDELAVALRVPPDREAPEVDPPAPDMGADQGGEEMGAAAPAPRGGEEGGCSATRSARSASPAGLALLALLVVTTPRGRRGSCRRAAR